MGKKNHNANGTANETAAAPPVDERKKCPTCGRLLPKAKPVDAEKVAKQKAKTEERLLKLQQLIKKQQERLEKADALLATKAE